jgi:hypothetical protein
LVCNQRFRIAVATVALLGLTLLGPGALRVWAQAQAFNASLSGSIYDKSGAVVPAATVTLSNSQKGITQTFTTQPDGRYVFTLLPPGTYSLKVEKAGFRPYLQTGIVLEVGQAATLDVSVELGAVTQEITVTAGAAMLNTQTADVGTTVTQSQVLDLPLDVRNVFGLVYLNASVNNSSTYQVVNGSGQSDTADQDYYFMNFGGGRFGTTGVLLDGHWDVGGDWGGYMYIPSVDNTQEFAVQTNSFSAQYGWSTGNVITAVTKSGTRDFHGDAWEFARDNVFDANNYFDNAAVPFIPLPAFKRNQFGATAGGPIYIPHVYEKRDKTFIFGDFEGLRQTTPTPVTDTIPTTGMRNGDFSALLGTTCPNPSGPCTDALGRPILTGQIYNPFSTRTLTNGGTDTVSGLPVSCYHANGTTPPATCLYRDPIPGNILSNAGLSINSVSKNFLQYWPSAPTNDKLSSNYSFAASAPSVWDEYSIRVDQNISEKSRFFARWSWKKEYKTLAADVFGASDPGGGGGIALDNRWDIAGNYTHTFNPSLVMSASIGMTRWAEGNNMQAFPFQPSSLGLPSFLDGLSNEFPDITISGMTVAGCGGCSSLGPGSLSSGAGQGSFPRNVGSYSVDITKSHGAHTMNMGFMGVVQQDLGGRMAVTGFNFPVNMTMGPDPSTASPSTSGFGFASFLLGTGSTGSTGVNNFGAFQRTMYGFYFQDAWKATRKLTLNLGLRYDFQPGQTERHNGTEWFNYAGTNPISADVGFNVPGELVYTSPSSPRLYNAQYTNFAPRIGLAYQLTNKLVMRLGVGTFYMVAMQIPSVNDGYSATTPYEGTVDGYTPLNLISDPFPNGYIRPTGNSLGGLEDVGNSPSQAVERFRPTPYVEQWMFGVQYALTNNDKIDVTYVGNHGLKLPYASVNANQLPAADLAKGDALTTPVTNPFYPYITSSGCGLSSPTVPAFQLMLPFPEYCNVPDAQEPAGFSNYNAAEITFTHRMAHGMQIGVSYTISKYIDSSSGVQEWATEADAGVRNNYNLYAERALDEDDIPQSLVVNYAYQLPVGHGKHFGTDMKGLGDAVLGGWAVTGITTYKSGFPLSISTADNSLSIFNAGQHPDIISDPHVSNPTINEWFNNSKTSPSFAQPAAFTFGDGPRNMPNLRAPGLHNWDLGIEKWWHWQEKVRIQFRCEMYDAFNNVNFFAPNQQFGNGAFGTITGALRPRDIQLAIKGYW